MSLQIIPKSEQAYGQFNGGQIVENKPIGFPQEGGKVRAYSNLFYWAYAEAIEESTIGLHPHQGFEIMSFVLRGSIRHYDTKLKEWRELKKGDAQIIRAGNGISHAEHMNKSAVMFQIWVDPNLDQTLRQPASYDDYPSSDFPVTIENGKQVKTYVGKDSPFHMDAPGIEIVEWTIDPGSQQIALDPNNVYSIYVLDGTLKLNGESVKQDDFVIANQLEQLLVDNTNQVKLFVIVSPQKLSYKTYTEKMQERIRS